MESQARSYPPISIRTIIDILLFLFGLTLAFGWITLPLVNFTYSFGLAIAGLFLLAVPFWPTRLLGLSVLLVGTYLVLRNADIISVQYLQYGLACFLLVIALVDGVRGVINSPRKDPSEQESL
ncbi:TPA: hypothetical protein DIV49_00605 [Candidatus Saccharibacteria bacterium]|nr:hypothetical protein [Candidatus Saccharibacteria bacterium]HRJ91128.1 hypothetical protein [Candidatus Saccharibacteria bacterium]